MSTLTQNHLQVAKRILRYLQGTLHFGIAFTSGPIPYMLTVILIGLGTLWIGDPSLVWCCSLAIVLSPSLPRNKTLFLIHQLRLNTVPWLPLLLSCIGLECFFEILVFFFLILLFSGVIMLVL